METIEKKRLSKKDIIKSYLIWTFFSHSTYNYERMQASGVLHTLAPSLEKLYGKETQELKDACKRHMEFFNTEPNVGGCILGITLALEEQKANGEDVDEEMISSIKTGLMGPLAGIGIPHSIGYYPWYGKGRQLLRTDHLLIDHWCCVIRSWLLILYQRLLYGTRRNRKDHRKRFIKQSNRKSNHRRGNCTGRTGGILCNCVLRIKVKFKHRYTGRADCGI